MISIIEFTCRNEYISDRIFKLDLCKHWRMHAKGEMWSVVVDVVGIAYEFNLSVQSAVGPQWSTIQIESNARNVGDATLRLQAFADFPFSPTKNHLESAVLKCVYIEYISIMQMCWRACNHFAVSLIYTIVSTCSRHRIRRIVWHYRAKTTVPQPNVLLFFSLSLALRFHFAHLWVSVVGQRHCRFALPNRSIVVTANVTALHIVQRNTQGDNLCTVNILLDFIWVLCVCARCICRFRHSFTITCLETQSLYKLTHILAEN